MSSVLSLRSINKNYGSVGALADIDLDVGSGAFVSLLGPSGCGKTTLLRIIAGILLPDSGDVVLGGRVVTDAPPYDRDLAMVFQDYALFPHMTVFDNVAFGIRMRGTADEKRRAPERVAEVLEMVRLGGYGNRLPAELSGGQQQRIAIARALAPRPALLLMDEPLSNLDAKVREEMRSELKEIQRNAAVTTVYVTHDQEEALALSDTVVVMSEGRIAQAGSPIEIYDAPRTRFVADSVGRANILDGRLLDGGQRFELAGGGPALDLAAPVGGPASAIAIRPENVEVTATAPARRNAFPARILSATYTGPASYLICDLGGIRVAALSVNRVGAPAFRPGEDVHVTIVPEAIRVLPESGGSR